MTKRYKFSLKKNAYLFIALLFSIAITWKSEARCTSAAEIYSTLTTDTIPKTKKDSLPLQPNTDSTSQDSTATVQRVDTFHLKLSKDTLDAPVEYEASDSGVLLVKEKKFLLYGKTKTTYKDIVLTAPKVSLDQQTNILTAYSGKDSLGNIITRAEFKQGSEGFQSDTISYNFKTKRGLTTNTFTTQSEMFVHGNYIKKVNDSIAFAKRVTMTTCDLDEPHFGFVANRAEFVTNKIAVTGPIHPEFEGVPIPVYLPFGIFPLKQGRHSGLLAPTFTATEQFGLGLEGLGYYQVLNDNVDVKVLTNLYSYGGWSATINPTYYKRYRYRGAFNLSIQHTKIAFKGDPDYNLTKTFQISWSHTLDQKAIRGANFSANVNAGSSKFNRYIVNDPNKNFQNQLYSSIAFSKTWQNKPYNLTLSANHNQNNNNHLINIILPDAGFTVTTLYPFQKKEPEGAPKWYEKIGIGYNGVMRNQTSFYDTTKNTFSHILDTLQWGAQHRFPISTSLPPLGPLLVSPFVSYEETWLTNRIHRQWDNVANKIDTLYNKKGLFIDQQMSFGIGINTTIYGTFGKPGKTQVRHVIRPNVSLNYRPNLSKKYYDVIKVDSSGRVEALPQVIGNRNLFAGYGYGRFGGISFGIDNNLEMKRHSKKDTTADGKKIRLIEGFGFTSGYNFLQDSLRLSPLNIYFRTTLFEKVSISAQTLYDPYIQDSLGRDTRRYVWQGDRFRLGRLQTGSISMSTSFQSKPRDPKKTTTPNPATGRISDPTLIGDEQRLQDYMRRNPGEFVDFNIPWSISLSYSLFFNQQRELNGKTKTKFTSNLSFSNSFSLTPKWMFTTNGYYDLNTMKLTTFSMTVSRDMHCWQMSVNVIPLGFSKYFSISISPKSSILQDLKVNRTRYFTNY